jgi:hypothetical protein
LGKTSSVILKNRTCPVRRDGTTGNLRGDRRRGIATWVILALDPIIALARDVEVERRYNTIVRGRGGRCRAQKRDWEAA